MVKIKGRKTTYEERIEIVEDCMKNGSNYSETSLKYPISYGQAYQWVRKFKENGIDSLRDKRGRTKPVNEMSFVYPFKRFLMGLDDTFSTSSAVISAKAAKNLI